MTDQVNTAPAAPEAATVDVAGDVSIEQVEQLLQAQEEEELGAEPEAEESVSEPAPEPEQRAVSEPEEGPKGDLRVALREERERRRQAEERWQATMQQQAAMNQYLAELNQRLNPQEAPPPPPDFESDPANYLKHNLDTVQRALGHFAAQQEQAQRAYAQQQQLEAMTAAVNTQEQSFAQKNADYYEALDYMRSRMAEEYKVLGVPEDQIPAAVTQNLRTFGLQALQAQQNPAERIYGLAKARGYNGSREANSDKLSTIAKGVAASRGTRSSAPASNGEMSLAQAAALSYKQIEKMSEDEFRRLAGG